MLFDWFKIFNVSDFDSGLISKNYTVELEGYGEKVILVSKANILSVTFDGVMISPDMSLNENNYHYRDERAVFLKDNGDVFIGIQV